MACLLVPLAPAGAFAQAAEDPGAQARLHFGPVGITPRLAIRDLGIDTNVYNTQDKRRDFTGTIAPAADAWLRLGRVRLTTTTGVEWMYFQDATNQRAFNLSERARLDVDLVRVAPYLSGIYERTRKRPNLEIDERVQQLATGGGAGVDLRLGARLSVDLEARVDAVDFGRDEFGDPNLAEALNHQSRKVRFTPRWKLSVLSTLAVRTELTRDRFPDAPVRNSDSLTVMPGFEFRPLAFIAGEAFVGVRRFDARDATAPDFTGVVVDVDVRGVVRDMTRVAVNGTRNVEYSFEASTPYFIQSGIDLEVTQALGIAWDAVGRVGGSRLAYQELAGSSNRVGLSPRVDRVVQLGGGVGRRIGRQLRIGINIDHLRRTSVVPGRSFSGLRVGGAFTYGN